MIIDDSRTLRHVVSVTLNKAGYETIDAVDGIDGLEKLARQEVNMIICDVNMPNMDGITFLKKIKRHKEHGSLPILMLTTESQAARREEARKAGATAWIIKPFTPEQILKAVDNLSC
jgi:two-component system chemotaxis response regulator CheY